MILVCRKAYKLETYTSILVCNYSWAWINGFHVETLCCASLATNRTLWIWVRTVMKAVNSAWLSLSALATTSLCRLQCAHTTDSTHGKKLLPISRFGAPYCTMLLSGFVWQCVSLRDVNKTEKTVWRKTPNRASWSDFNYAHHLFIVRSCWWIWVPAYCNWVRHSGQHKQRGKHTIHI